MSESRCRKAVGWGSLCAPGGGAWSTAVEMGELCRHKDRVSVHKDPLPTHLSTVVESVVLPILQMGCGLRLRGLPKTTA